MPSDFTTIEVGFSAQTSERQTQEIVDNKLERRRKGIFGPKVGTVQGKAVLFVDDLNMPQKEEWGAQPPIEILRQFLDSGGWYDNKDKDKPFRNVQDVYFVAAMGPPGGGKTFITPRMLRHLNLISLANFDDDVMIKIYSTILQWYFIKGKFLPEVSKQENKIVTATLDIYKFAFNKLLPTPLKSHYLFNLRDYGKVIFGVCLADCQSLTT
jgi:dynein heavy chain, axonemal